MRKLHALFVIALAIGGCDQKKGGGPGAGASSSAGAGASSSADAGASSSAGAGSSASASGACKELSQNVDARCDAISNGDPTARAACKEGVAALVQAGDDAKCFTALHPPPPEVP